MAVMINGEMRYVGRTLSVRDIYRMDMFGEEVKVLNENDAVEILEVFQGDRPEVDATPEVIDLAKAYEAERIARLAAKRELERQQTPLTKRYLSQSEIHEMARAVLSDLDIQPLSQAEKVRVADDYARNQLRVIPRASACKLAAKLATASWREITLQVKREIEEAQS